MAIKMAWLAPSPLPGVCSELLLRPGGLPSLGPSLSVHTGHSGMGRYHGKFSFDTFSNHRACLLSSLGLEKFQEIHYPPYTEWKKWLIRWALSYRSCTLL